MGSIRNLLKRILPPPVRTFLREIEGLRQLTEKQTRRLEQSQRETLKAVERMAAEQQKRAENLEKLLAAQTEELRRENRELAKRLERMEKDQTVQTALRQAEEQRTQLAKKVDDYAAAAKRKDPFGKTLKLAAEQPGKNADRADPADAVVPEGFRRVVPVVFASNDEYAPYAGVAIESILRNAGEGNFYRIYMLYDRMSRYHRESLEQIRRSNASVHCIDVSKRVDALREDLFERAHFTRETYFRFLIPELFSFYDKIIYLDCDLVVRADLAELLAEELGTDLAAAVWNRSAGNFANQRLELGLELERYVNAGVLVINVRQWRAEDTAAACLRTLRETPREQLLCLDQDVLNMVCKDRIRLLDPAWNVCWNMIYGRLAQEWREDQCRILHFASGMKPWSTPGTALSVYFWEYARTSCFYEEILEKEML